MPTPTLQEQVNDLLKFVFSSPKTPGKVALAQGLRADWRKVIKKHAKIPPDQAREIDAFTPAEVALVSRYMAGAVRAGKTPRLKIVPRLKAASGAARAKPQVSSNGDTNINC